MKKNKMNEELIHRIEGGNDKEQSEFCDILDTWYVACKGEFEGVHPLGMRKEDLKRQVCKWIESKRFAEETK